MSVPVLLGQLHDEEESFAAKNSTTYSSSVRMLCISSRHSEQFMSQPPASSTLLFRTEMRENSWLASNGCCVGIEVGYKVGSIVGSVDGLAVGTVLGCFVGSGEGPDVGCLDGSSVGKNEG